MAGAHTYTEKLIARRAREVSLFRVAARYTFIHIYTPPWNRTRLGARLRFCWICTTMSGSAAARHVRTGLHRYISREISSLCACVYVYRLFSCVIYVGGGPRDAGVQCRALSINARTN